MSFFREIKERHVLQAAGVYVGGCWVLIEILDRLVERYLLSPTLTDLVFWGLFSLLPAVILMAYVHGRPGKDEVTRTEIVGIPINLIATTGLLVTMFSGEHMGSTAERIMVMDEEGEPIETYIPKADFRHSLMLFFWDNQTGNSDLDWWQYGITDILTHDLQQNPYLSSINAFTNYEWGFYSNLRRSGYEDALDIPILLQRQVADDYNQKYFVNGKIQQQGQKYTLVAGLYQTDVTDASHEIRVTGNEVMPLIDELSNQIKKILEVPSGGGRLAEDLPVIDQYSDSLIALEKYATANTIRLLHNDYARALEALDEALEEDKSFALAGLEKIDLLNRQGRTEEAIAVGHQIEQHEYKLTALDSDLLKANIYALNGEREKSTLILEKRVEITPQDTQALWRLGDRYKWTGRIDKALNTYMRISNLDPTDNRAILELSMLYRATGNNDQAIAYAQEYINRRPDDMTGAVQLGTLYMNTGLRSLAREEFERAQLLRSGVVTPLIMLADLAARSGDSPTARSYLKNAAQVANSPQQDSLVLDSEVSLMEREGRIREAIALMEQRRLSEVQFNAPVEIVFDVDMRLLAMHISLGENQQVWSLLETLETQLQAPYDQFLQIAHAFANITEEDFEAAETAIINSEIALEQFGLEHIKYHLDYARGLLAEKHGDYLEAAVQYQNGIDRILGSVLGDALSNVLIELYAGLARSKILSGDNVGAVSVLEEGFQLDGNSAMLWIERARLQWQQKQIVLARASMNYAMAIWANADRDYYLYIQAEELASKIQET